MKALPTLLFVMLFTFHFASAQKGKPFKLLNATVERRFPGIPTANITDEYFIKVLVLNTDVRFPQVLIAKDTVVSKAFRNGKFISAAMTIEKGDTLTVRCSKILQKRNQKEVSKLTLLYTYNSKKGKLAINKIKKNKAVYLP